MGKLFVIATPIGNLEDISFRAIRTLKEAGVIFAEDTRRFQILAQKYNVKTKVFSYRDQNHDKTFPQILQILNDGVDVALVSDSGTPLISDQGFKLVRDLRAQNIEVIPIPGPNAAIAALSVSGMATDKFTFLGFLPKSGKKRIDLLKKWGNSGASVIIYESPFRMKKLLEEIETALGERDIFIGCEITKKFEKYYSGQVSEVKKSFASHVRGEFTVIIGKQEES